MKNQIYCFLLRKFLRLLGIESLLNCFPIVWSVHCTSALTSTETIVTVHSNAQNSIQFPCWYHHRLHLAALLLVNNFLQPNSWHNFLARIPETQLRDLWCSIHSGRRWSSKQTCCMWYGAFLSQSIEREKERGGRERERERERRREKKINEERESGVIFCHLHSHSIPQVPNWSLFSDKFIFLIMRSLSNCDSVILSAKFNRLLQKQEALHT